MIIYHCCILTHLDPDGLMPAVSFDPTKIVSTIHSIKSFSSGPDEIHPNILRKTLLLNYQSFCFLFHA